MSGRMGMFDLVKELLRAPKRDEEELMRNAAHVLDGPRGRKIVFLEDDQGVAAFTSKSTGNVFIAGEVKGNPKKLHVAVRHELLHSVMTPRSRVLNYVHSKILSKSGLYIYFREASAQAYGARSLWQGMKFPFEYGYVTPGWLATELGVLGVGGLAVGSAVQNATD